MKCRANNGGVASGLMLTSPTGKSLTQQGAPVMDSAKFGFCCRYITSRHNNKQCWFAVLHCIIVPTAVLLSSCNTHHKDLAIYMSRICVTTDPIWDGLFQQ